jgi:hypothetical protein
MAADTRSVDARYGTHFQEKWTDLQILRRFDAPAPAYLRLRGVPFRGTKIFADGATLNFLE